METITFVVLSAGFIGGMTLAAAYNVWDWWHDRHDRDT